MNKIEKTYKWVASSDDGCYNKESNKTFDTKEECYNDMRNAALEKLKWNTDYIDLIADESFIDYDVRFYPDGRIIHESYSGVYTYEIKEV